MHYSHGSKKESFLPLDCPPSWFHRWVGISFLKISFLKVCLASWNKMGSKCHEETSNFHYLWSLQLGQFVLLAYLCFDPHHSSPLALVIHFPTLNYWQTKWILHASSYLQTMVNWFPKFYCFYLQSHFWQEATLVLRTSLFRDSQLSPMGLESTLFSSIWHYSSV